MAWSAGEASWIPRQDRILALLHETGFQSVADLAARMNVSDMTIRRDLRKLESAGELRVVHGGASALPQPSPLTYDARAIEHARAKRSIGRLAAALVEIDETIGIDAGTSAHELAEALPLDFSGSVVTCSVPVIVTVLERAGAHLIGTGGDLYRPSRAFVGPAAVESIDRLRCKTTFIGAGAADAKGLYVAADIERPTKRALMNGADRVVALLDSSKFQSSAPVRLCTWDEIDVLVTEQAPPSAVQGALDGAGVEVQLAQ